MNILTIYLFGVGISGFLLCLMTQSTGFVNFMFQIFKEARKKTAQTEDEQAILNRLSDDTLMMLYIFNTSLFSWLGVLVAIIDWLGYLISKTDN